MMEPQPMSQKTKHGFNTLPAKGRGDERVSGEDSAPSLGVVGSGWELSQFRISPTSVPGNPLPLASRANGVDQIAAACLESGAVGVGSDQDAAALAREGNPPLNVVCAQAVAAAAVGVGQIEDGPAVVVDGEQEEALAAVRCARLLRRKHVPLRIEPDVGQGPENGVKSSRSDPWDVFQEDDTRSNTAKDAVDGWPDPPVVVFVLSPPRDAVRLARETSGKDERVSCSHP